MALLVFAKTVFTYPAVFVTGSDQRGAEEKTRDFLYSSARLVLACTIVWGIFKAQHCEPLRKIALSMPILAGHVGRMIVFLEPISLLVNSYLITTADSKWKAAGYCAVVGLWQCIVQSFREWTKEPPEVFFSATVQRAKMNIDPLTHSMNIAVWKVPESRLGVGLFLTIFGVYQLHAYTVDRWNLLDAPTDLALKGICHVGFGLCQLGMYEQYNQKLESGAKKETYLYKAADLCTPALAGFVPT
jgi:hypothetical protein